LSNKAEIWKCANSSDSHFQITLSTRGQTASILPSMHSRCETSKYYPPTPRISVPLHIVIWRYCFFRGVNPGYGGKLLHISSKTASLLCLPKKPCTHSIIFFCTPRRMLCNMSARTIAGGSMLGRLHGAFWMGLTSSWANLFWHPSELASCIPNRLISIKAHTHHSD